MMYASLTPLGLVALSLASVALGQAVDPTAQPSAGNFPPQVHLTSQQDHQRMQQLLGIKSLRPGVDGMNPNAPNAANYDEAKANPFPKLPDPLVLKNGQPVTTADQWWQQRRPEIVEDFDREIYGRMPAQTPKVTWEVTKSTHEKVGDIPVITRQLVGHVDNSAYPLITVNIDLTLTTPADAAGPVPVMMEFGFVFGPRAGGARGPATAMAGRPTTRPAATRPFPGFGPGGAPPRADLATTGDGQGLGLRDHLPVHRAGR